MSDFSADISKWVSATKDKIDAVTREAVVLAAQGVVMKSPVGNPDLWKGPAPEGYVGGRFRANWMLGVGAMDATTTEHVDRSGGTTLRRIINGMANQGAGKVYWITNSLPYAIPLEYGHSTQAPQGMVRVTFAELPGAIDAYAASRNR